MQPTDHKSIALLYFFYSKISSGARYHRVATWIERFDVFSYLVFVSFFIPSDVRSAFILLYSVCNSSKITVLASPKSHNFISDNSTFVRIFYGFRSLCNTWHSWQNFNPNNTWYTTFLISSNVRILLEKNIFLISFSSYSNTKNNVTFYFSSTINYLSWMMFGCFKWRNKIIYRSTRVDSCKFVRKLFIFFIATISFVFMFRALMTTDDTPWPTCCNTSYLLAIIYPCFSWFWNAFLLSWGFMGQWWIKKSKNW